MYIIREVVRCQAAEGSPDGRDVQGDLCRDARDRPGLVASRINLDLAQIPHRLPPELLKALSQTVREFAIADEQRRKSALLDEGMVQRQHHGLVVHDVKGMAKLSGIPDARHLSQIMPMMYAMVDTIGK